MLASKQPMRKRARIEREPCENGGILSYLARELVNFCRGGAPWLPEIPSSSLPEESDNNNENDALGNVDLVEEGLRRVTATGIDDRRNELLLRVARTASATANVVFFPGDVQDFHHNMSSGAYSEYSAYSYEQTADLLAAKFGESANVWIVRPSRFQFGAFACFDGFVETNTFGAALTYHTDGRAVQHLVSLLEDATTTLMQQDSDPVSVSRTLPFHLVGFSKGCVVLNQIATELGARWNSSPENNQEEPSRTEQDFMDRLQSIHWLDGGNGSQRGAVPTDEAILQGLAVSRVQVHVHVTPYQFAALERPWIQQEVLYLVSSLTRLMGNVELHKYRDNDAATLAAHFQILSDFQTTSRSTKTGRPPSPEVSLQPVSIQSRG